MCCIFRNTRKIIEQPTNALERRKIMKLPTIKASEVFVIATGIAAFFHSTNVLGTLFNAEQPAIENIVTWIQFVHFLGWIVPSGLIALTLDIGQIATSHEIKQHGLTWPRALTFLTFALATYNLQWVYLSLHMPELILGDGVSEQYQHASILLLNAQQWIIPALLPLATLLYTFSGDNQQKPLRKQHESKHVSIVDTMPFMPIEQNEHVAICDICGWQSEVKETSGKAAQSLAAHKRHCEVQ